MNGKGRGESTGSGKRFDARARPFGACVGLGVLALAASAAGGCGADFAPFDRVTGLRVLAMQSEPAAPLPGETATFAALVVTPSSEPAPPLTYKWSWCPVAGSASAGYACPVDEEKKQQFDAILADRGQPPLPAFDLGTDPTATSTIDIPADVFKSICDGLIMLPGQSVAFPLDCSAGFPIQIMLTVSSDSDSLTAVQTVKLRFDPATPANANPPIDGLSAILGGMGMAMPMPIVATAADGPLVTLPRQVETRVQVAMDQSVAEVYQGEDDDGNPATLTERLFLTWFIETGDMNNPRTSFYSGSTNFADLLKNDWTPATARDYPSDTARIFVVAHDNRGGVSWRTGTVDLGPAP